MRVRLLYAVALLVFFMSGFAALIYQVVWQRLLTLYYGVGAVSTAIVVALFMLGLGLGSVAGGMLAERARRRAVLYIACEAGIAAFGALSLAAFSRALPLLTELGNVASLMTVAALLLIPTTLMGMTLPVMVKVMNQLAPDVGRNVALLYFANTIGASIGAFAASYWLISFYGLDGAIWFAVGINIALCAFAGLIVTAPSRQPVVGTAAGIDDIDDGWSKARWMTLVSGSLAIGYQLVWFRVLSTLLKPNSYVFSTVLSVYLLGIALGSLWMSRFITRLSGTAQRARVFHALNASIAVVTLITFSGLYLASRFGWATTLIRSTFDNELHPPYAKVFAMPAGVTVMERLTALASTWDLVLWSMLIVLPGTLLMGASFPLVTTTAIGRSERDGFRAGLIAAITIAGNVGGAVFTGFVLLPMLGTERTLQIFVCIGALWVLGVSEIGGRRIRIGLRAAAAAAIIVTAIVTLPGPTALYAMLHPPSNGRERIITEDVDGTTVTFRGPRDGRDTVSVYIGGSSHASYPGIAYQTEALEVATYARRLDHVLVIGFGGGDLTDRLLRTPGVSKVTVVEISDSLLRNIAQIPVYQRLLADPRVTLVRDDGRRYLQRTRERFDVLVMDPLQSTAAYSNNLYSLEFFNLVRDRLQPDGLAMVWFNEYYVIPKTLGTAFQHMQCFYFFCLASAAPMQRNDERRAAVWEGFEPIMREGIQKRLDQPYYNKGGRDEAMAAGRLFPLNRDLDPITEYYVGYVAKSLRGRF
jgi:spermidine synthase/MFS family permease